MTLPSPFMTPIGLRLATNSFIQIANTIIINQHAKVMRLVIWKPPDWLLTSDRWGNSLRNLPSFIVVLLPAAHPDLHSVLWTQHHLSRTVVPRSLVRLRSNEGPISPFSARNRMTDIALGRPGYWWRGLQRIHSFRDRRMPLPRVLSTPARGLVRSSQSASVPP